MLKRRKKLDYFAIKVNVNKKKEITLNFLQALKSSHHLLKNRNLLIVFRGHVFARLAIGITLST